MGGEALAQEGCGLAIPRGVHDPAGWGSEQPDLLGGSLPTAEGLEGDGH